MELNLFLSLVPKDILMPSILLNIYLLKKPYPNKIVYGLVDFGERTPLLWCLKIQIVVYKVHCAICYGESFVLGMSKITEKVLEDLSCEGNILGTLHLNKVHLLCSTWMHLVRGNQWETHLFELSSSIRNHINWNSGLTSTIIIFLQCT